jgi:hypothetical protein
LHVYQRTIAGGRSHRASSGTGGCGSDQRDRKPWWCYGATIATLLPALWTWSQQPTALRFGPPAVPEALRWALVVVAVGVFVSGVRDLYAAARFPHGDWPWIAGREVRKP